MQTAWVQPCFQRHTLQRALLNVSEGAALKTTIQILGRFCYLNHEQIEHNVNSGNWFRISYSPMTFITSLSVLTGLLDLLIPTNQRRAGRGCWVMVALSLSCWRSRGSGPLSTPNAGLQRALAYPHCCIQIHPQFHPTYVDHRLILVQIGMQKEVRRRISAAIAVIPAPCWKAFFLQRTAKRMYCVLGKPVQMCRCWKTKM